MGKIENRKRCLNCEFYKRNLCPLMGGADVFQIENCILEREEIKSLKEGTLDYFVFWSDPLLYLSYLGYKEKAEYPKVGQTVLTLTGGFSSLNPGKFLHIDSEDDIQLFLSDEDGNYVVSKDVWWKRLFKLQ